MSNICASKEDRKQTVCAMTHEERLAHAKNNKSYGFGMIGSGVGIFAGISGGLYNAIGAAAIGIGFGCSIGLFLGSMSFFSIAKETLEWDAEMEAGEKV
mmetsp:Transcript_6765/g.12747  ORF Transcript_6765/g.12747 Transcript_6765/m.12747 type:complete len:99 (-) Transcript_6765:499-795(-)